MPGKGADNQMVVKKKKPDVKKPDHKKAGAKKGEPKKAVVSKSAGKPAVNPKK